MKIQQLTSALVIALLTTPAFAIYQNGGFETNSFASWTLGGGTNPALSGTEPFTGASVIINGSTPGPSSIVGATPDTNAPTLVLPRSGQFTAKVNDAGGGALITTLAQTDVITAADRDPSDNALHVRFSFAPVVQNPGHTPAEQPYFYVHVKNTTDNVVVFEQFAYSNQPGVNFLNGPGDWKYLDFQNVDATVPNSALGKNIETYLIGADCSQGGHGGYVYLDGFGSTIPNGTPPPRIAVPALSQYSVFLLAGMFGLLGVFTQARRS
jgi:hypothetical protein